MPSPLTSQSFLDSAPEQVFDTLTKLVSHLLDVPVALVSILDEHRQFFKSQYGLPEPWATARETPLSRSFCQHVATGGTRFVVEDARIDPRVQDNLAVPEIGVVAYLGVPLHTRTGQTYGALCAISNQPRRWSAADIETMEALALQVMGEIALRVTMLAQQNELEAAHESA